MTCSQDELEEEEPIREPRVCGGADIIGARRAESPKHRVQVAGVSREELGPSQQVRHARFGVTLVDDQRQAIRRRRDARGSSGLPAPSMTEVMVTMMSWLRRERPYAGHCTIGSGCESAWWCAASCGRPDAAYSFANTA
jgi:hypothetical protein